MKLEIPEWLSSIQETIKERTKNPFLFTFTCVWCIHNWRVLYGILTFNNEFTFQQRIEYISKCYPRTKICSNILHVIWVTFLVLLVTYILVNVARILTNFFEKRITPRIISWTNSKAIVPISTYNLLEQELNELQQKYEKERERRKKFELEFEKSETKALESISTPDEKIMKEIENIEQQMSKSDARHEAYLSELRQVSSMDAIKNVLDNIDKHIVVQNEYHLYKKLEKDGIANFVGTNEPPGSHYKFTGKGELFYQYVLDNY